MPTEKSIVEAILKYLNSLEGTRARKIHGGPYMAGWPDILCVKDGQAYFFEVKRPGGKATKLQLYELSEWMKAGAIVAIVTSVEDVRAVLERETVGI
jgi:hypothetical protein